jgi:hypothetical protein
VVWFVSLFGCSSGGDDGALAVERGALHASNLQPTASPTACWVKDDQSTTSDAAFDAATQQVQDVLSQWEQASGLNLVWQGRCGAPVGGVYPGDIRILWNELDRGAGFPIPGCSLVHGNGNWGGFPGTYPTQCRWNAAFATGQAINNYLHESGHTLGFIHEHERSDNVDPGCGSASANHDNNLLTPYDVMSVMHYRYSGTCVAPGNLGNTGLSDLDKLGAEIAYPKSSQVPIASSGAMAYGGGLAFRTDLGGALQPAWYARGALSSVFAGFSWTVNSSVTTGLSRTISSSLGSSPVSATMQFTDPWGRSRAGTTQVLTSNAAHTAMIMASVSG